ncbi:hypothetical protein EV360DRAFT_21979, partial [Lentinula raphanica]
QKLQTRMRIAATMGKHCQDNGELDAEQYWLYVTDALRVLGDSGMSDEEDGEEDVVIDGHSSKQKVKLVKDLWFRHESFRTLFVTVDETPEAKSMIFTQAGRISMKRIRSGIVDYRTPSRGYPEGIFRTEFLNSLE